ncbi:MAG TPA: terminase family protein [Gemmataceae bacterium]|nr:terminase family protein [Gemmataceae bacterium]
MYFCTLLALDPSAILVARGLTPDPWQRDFLFARDRQILLNCSRQSGKSTVVSALALHAALFTPGGLVLLLSPSQRQSAEIFRKVHESYVALGRPIPAVYESQLRLELANGARVLCLPGREETIRSFGGVTLLVLDEAARIPDRLYRSVRPMLAVSRGRLVALSTPFGRRGWFWEEWQGGGPWKRVQVTWRDCPRITADFIAEETRSMGAAWVAQEYECSFNSREGLVYPDFMDAVLRHWPAPPPDGRGVGGIDFGWRNPFAALAGVLDRDDVLWIDWERYLSQTPLHEHAAALRRAGGVSPRSVVWYADPAGATEIAELRASGLTVRRADNDIRLGIMATAARLRTGRLKVHGPACPNLLHEAGMYRYPSASERASINENPVDEHNHALGALRYLIAALDARFIARLRRRPEAPAAESDKPVEPRNEPDLWTEL